MKPVLKKHELRCATDRGQSSGKPLHHNPAEARLIRFGGRVQAVEFTCPCGTTTVLELNHYEDGHPESGSKS